MHQASFRLLPDPENAAHHLVAIAIDGRDLIELVRAYEAPYARREGHPKLAGVYQYLSAEFELDHFAGKHRETPEGEGGKAMLAGCDCGIPSCWPLLCEIVTEDNQTVVWKNFEQPFRGPNSAADPWDYSGFGPFYFSLNEYEHALATLVAQLTSRSS
jgi:hypothetical protein